MPILRISVLACNTPRLPAFYLTIHLHLGLRWKEHSPDHHSLFSVSGSTVFSEGCCLEPSRISIESSLHITLWSFLALLVLGEGSSSPATWPCSLPPPADAEQCQSSAQPLTEALVQEAAPRGDIQVPGGQSHM